VRALLIALSACRAPAAPGTAENLTAHLAALAGADEARRTREVAGWLVDEAAWNRTIVVPYRALWADYVGAFDAARPALVAQLPHAGAARRHFAGDPKLTLPEARLRWAVPTLYPSMVADGIDAVFVFDGAHWRALAGLDAVVLAHLRALDPACAELVARAGPRGTCTEIAWAIADSGLRGDRAGFAHACGLAAPHCGNPPP